jgi:hypothetical protein
VLPYITEQSWIYGGANFWTESRLIGRKFVVTARHLGRTPGLTGRKICSDPAAERAKAHLPRKLVPKNQGHVQRPFGGEI